MHEYMIWQRGGPGAVVKAAYLESQRLWAQTPLWHSCFKEKKCFFHGLKPHSFYFHLDDLAILCHVL